MFRRLISQLRQRYKPNTSGFHLHRFAKEAGASVRQGARILDAGAGSSPYKKYFQHCQYEATDLCERQQRTYEHVNYTCDLTSIPVEDGRYDLVLCTQVLEHVPDPLAVLQELVRVLKPQGSLWLSTPLYFPEHEIPHDFYRYTQFGLRHLFAKAGLQIKSLDWVGGYFGTLAYQLSLAWHHLPIRPKDYGGGLCGVAAALMAVVVKPLLLILAFVYSRLDLRHLYTAKGHCVDYRVVAERPAQDHESIRVIQ